MYKRTKSNFQEVKRLTVVVGIFEGIGELEGTAGVNGAVGFCVGCRSGKKTRHRRLVKI